MMTPDNSIQALRLANPKAFNDIIGFQVETFYTSGLETILWERPAILGKTKKIKTDKLMKQCFSKIQDIQMVENVISYGSFHNLCTKYINESNHLETLFYEVSKSACVNHKSVIYEYLVASFIEDFDNAIEVYEEQEVYKSMYERLTHDDAVETSSNLKTNKDK